MLTSTTTTLQDREITEYLGVVSAETIIGANIIKDIFAGIRDILGGRSESYEKVLREAKDSALKELVVIAEEKGADGIIGIDLDYESIQTGNSNMLMVTASGTAVKYH